MIRTVVIATLLSVLLAFSGKGYAQTDGKEKSRILSTLKYVAENNLIIGKLDEQGLRSLPIGLSTSDGRALIVIDSVRYTDRGTFIRAIASVTLPGSTEQMIFAGSNIAFSSAGFAGSSNTKLTLISRHEIDINEHVTLVLPDDGHNYIEWDCNGFKSVNIKGDFVFDENMVQPDKILNPGADHVTASLELNVKDLHNIMASVNITPFQISGMEGFGFKVQNATVDLSDIANPEGFSFPKEYESEYKDNIKLWRGFYVQKIQVRLPGEFSSASGPVSIDAANMLIDDMGVSGVFGANNILNEGNMSGWPFTVDRLEAVLIRNQLRGGGAYGTLNIPFLGKDTLGYAARMYNDDGQLMYSFGISLQQEHQYNMPFGGHLTLKPGSSIEIEKSADGLKPKAVLNGSMTVKQPLLSIEQIKFENLTLITEAPYITQGYFTLTTTKSNLGSFPVSFDKITLGISNGTVALGANARLSFMGEGDKGFSGSTYIKVQAKHTVQVVNAKLGIKKSKWEFDKIIINEVAIKYSGAFDLSGRLSIFNDDPEYGKGFYGSLDLRLPVAGSFKVAGYFGNKEAENYKYWNVSFLVPVKLPIGPILSIDGIMGGLSYHMTRPVNFTPTFKSDSVLKNEGSTPMVQLDYKPDKSAALGVLAGVSLKTTASERVFSGEAAFEILFREGGGIKYAMFHGAAYFLKAGEKMADKIGGLANKLGANVNLDGVKIDSKGAPLYAALNVVYDIDNSVFHANLSAYLNAAGIMRGGGGNNLLGEAVIHFAPGEWYIYAGRPSRQLSVEVINVFNAHAYFMVGSRLESFPAPPRELKDLFDFNTSFMSMENQLAKGGGMGLGVHFDTKFGLDGFFYAYLKVLGGADLMLRDMSGMHCKGSSGPIGFDGWYASAQAYAYLDGRVGVAGFDVLRLQAAFLMQAKLPNPSWFRAAVVVKYRLLCGLIKGKYTLNVQFGNECELVADGNELGGIKMIGDIAPVSGGKDVDVFAAPQVAFNTAVETEFEMMNVSEQINTYRIKLDELKLYVQNKEMPGSTIKWNKERDVALLDYRDVLPANSTMRLGVKVHIEKKVNGGNWQPLKDQKGLATYETAESAFTTGDAPKTISDNNVQYAYPLKQQFNFYKDEYGKGYIKLIKGTPSVFETKDKEGKQWSYACRFVKSDGSTAETNVSYDAANTTVNFDIPSASLLTNTIYILSMVKKPLGQTGIDHNLVRNETTIVNGEDETTITQNTLGGTAQGTGELEVYNSAFRTSKYNTFVDKVSAYSNKEELFDIAVGNLALIGQRNSTDELYDMYELEGSKNVQPLVYAEATTTNKWYQEFAYPLLYEKYPADNTITIQWRSTETYGIAPLKGIHTYNFTQKESFLLSEAEVGAGTTEARSGKVVNSYLVSWLVARDYQELKNKIAAKYLTIGFGNVPEAASRLLLNNTYRDIAPDHYGFRLKYRLPGINMVTSEKEMSMELR